jgi:hypothetical protein
MPDKSITAKAKNDLAEGKSSSTAAGEFVREEIDHVREGKHGARSPQQAIAIGLSEARRAGIPVKAPAKGKSSADTQKKAHQDTEAGKNTPKSHAAGASSRSKARTAALKKESTSTASHAALSKHAKTAAKKRQSAEK